jgi:hypothetical protein
MNNSSDYSGGQYRPAENFKRQRGIMIKVLQILALTIAGFPAVAGNWNSYFRGAWRCLILIALLAVFTPAHA